MRRHSVNKASSARGFNRATGRTKAINKAGPMRGGIRL